MGETTLSEAISNTIAVLLSQIYTALPGRFESYKKEKASVKPLIKKTYIDGSIVSLPVITNVPVMFPRTQTAGITFPISKGDGCLLIFSGRSLENWLSSGKDSEPGDNRKYDLTDVIAIPGLFSFAQKNIASNNQDLEVQNSSNKITIKKNGDIEIGGSGLKKLITELFQTTYNTHTHIIPTSLPTVPPGVAPTATPLPQSTSADLTTKVKAQ